MLTKQKVQKTDSVFLGNKTKITSLGEQTSNKIQAPLSDSLIKLLSIMKYYISLILFSFLSITLFAQVENVGIGTVSPDSSAVLDITAADQGVLLPRMDSTHRKNIINPKDGLILYDSTTYSFWFFRDTEWREFHWEENIDSSITNELQMLSLSGQNLTLSSGNTIILPSSSGVFEYNSSVVRNSGANTDDFVFGDNELPISATNVDEKLFFFDEDKGAFRAGRLSNSDVWGTVKMGNQSIGMGINTEASGTNTIALGNRTVASSDNAVAMGNSSNASGDNSVALGAFNNASGSGSIAIGSNSNAIGFNSVALGKSAKAQGNESLSTGNNTVAFGLNATAMGYKSEGNGEFSTAMGWQSKANGDRSMALGIGTRADAYGSVAIGRYNLGLGNGTNWVATDPILEIGIGALSTSRENALTILKDGTVTFKEYTFPNLDGSAGQVMQTDGFGNISWTSTADNVNDADADPTNELITSLSLNTGILSIADSGGTYNANLTNIKPHSIVDNDSDTRIEFNDPNDKIIFTSDGNTIAKMETDSVFINGKLRIGESSQSRIYLGNTFIQKGTSSNFAISNNTNNTDDLVINNQGEIGIGVSNPQEILDVYAPNDFDGIRIKGSTMNDQVQLMMDNNSTEGREYVFRSTGANASQGGGKLLVRDSEVGQTRLVLDSTGNFGIGIIDPTEKLHVNGDVKIDALSGIGTANVTVNSDGKLTRTNIPTVKKAYIDFPQFVGASQETVQIHIFDGAYVNDLNGVLYAPLSIVPDGATITQIDAIYRDDDASESIEFGFLYHNGTPSGIVNSSLVGYSTTNVGARSTTSYNGLNFTLDRTANNYTFYAESDDWAGLFMFGIIIYYTE